ncbi:MAG: hypothetical protein K2K57_05110 [Oscillospiraceae bacterium]|nr:hypothetical protein [Oscillospiraceae bacterium]
METREKADILIPYNEDICCDNEIALQEFTGDVFDESEDLEKYADFDYYCLFSEGKADIPMSDDEAFRINMGIIICRFALSDDIISEFKNGEGIWASKYWGFSDFSPAVLKAICGYYAAWQYSQIFLEGDAAEYAYAPEYIEENGREFLKVNEKCLELYSEIYCAG